MAKLFNPLTIRSITLKNRIVVSPMCQYSATDGFANDWHLVHLGSRAVGGAALVIMEATAVSPEGRISPGDMGIWKDEQLDMLKRITRFIDQQGAIAGIQLAHAGRKASHSSPWTGGELLAEEQGGWESVAPVALPFSDKERAPYPLQIADIKNIVDDFAAATRRARTAGFRVIEIHAAHGYLINEFLSPLVNTRTDEYGGSFENRMRFLVEIIQAVRSEWPEELPLFVRISASDWTDGGWTVDDSIKLACMVKELGVDLIDCSSGGVIPHVAIPAAPGYQVPFSEAVRKNAGLLTGAVGIIVTPAQAEEILQREQADLVIIARQLLRDPYFPLHAANELGENVKWPVQYERAKRPVK